MASGVLKARFNEALHQYVTEEKAFFSAAFAYEDAKRKVEEMDADYQYQSYDNFDWVDGYEKKRLTDHQNGLHKQYSIAVRRKQQAESDLRIAESTFRDIPFEIMWKKRELLDLRLYFAEVRYKQAEHVYAITKAKYTYSLIRLRQIENSEMQKSQAKVCQKAEKDFCEAKRIVETAKIKYTEVKSRSDIMGKYLCWNTLFTDEEMNA